MDKTTSFFIILRKTASMAGIVAFVFGALMFFQKQSQNQAPADQSDTPEYRLNVKRNFGFSSGSQVKGAFTNSIVGPAENIRRVTFTIDGEVMAVVDQPPFSFSYNTEDYTVGWHDLSAAVETTDGSTVETVVRRFEFVSAAEEWSGIQRIIIPMLGLVAGITVIGFGVQYFFMRDKNNHPELGAPRNYGYAGGAICKRCGRPFARHIWGANLGLWKFDRCDYCGKWGFYARESIEMLRIAEQAELANAKPEVAAIDEDDAQRKKLDESKYVDRI